MKHISSKEIITDISKQDLSNLIHRVGHDIGNPLTSIISLSSIIETFSDIEAEKLSSYSKTINKEAWKINRLSQCLVNMLSTREINRQSIKIENVIDRAVSKASSYFKELENLEFDIEVQANLEAESERDQLTIALREIITNHIQACIEDDCEKIIIKADSNTLTVSSATKLDLDPNELFKPGVSGFKKISSTGVGLFTTACILKRLGGHCEIEVSQDLFSTKLIFKS